MFKLYMGDNTLVKAEYQAVRLSYRVIVPQGMAILMQESKFLSNYRELTTRELDLISQTDPESQIAAISDGGKQYHPPPITM